jgi:hypothetical protein
MGAFYIIRDFGQDWQCGGTMSAQDSTDPVRLALLHASFRLADQEHAQRSRPGVEEPQTEPNGDSPDEEAVQLAALLKSHFASLDPLELEKLRSDLAHSLLIELDRKMASQGALPGKRFDPELVREDRSSLNAVFGEPRVAFVSHPWK